MKLRRLAYAIMLVICVAPAIALANTFVPLDRSIYQGSTLANVYDNNTSIVGSGSDAIGFVLNNFWTLVLSFASVMVVGRWVYAGYLLGFYSDSSERRRQAKTILTDSTIWLIVLWGGWLIFYQINPCILDFSRLMSDFGGSSNTSQTCTVSMRTVPGGPLLG